MNSSSSDPGLIALGRALQALGYSHTTVTPATHARVNARPANARATDIAGVFGWSRAFDADLLPRSLFDAATRAGVLARDGDLWRSTVRASTLAGELFLHSAYPTTSADAVFFGPDTYRFTAALGRHLERRPTVLRAIDIGCGAGPGAVLIGRRYPGAEVLAVDINDVALRFTASNAALANVSNVRACRSDLLSAVEGVFDLIVANPPYLLDAHERIYRHGGGSLGEGLSLAIAGLAETRLAPGGTLLLYTGSAIFAGRDGFRDALGQYIAKSAHHWHYEELDPDVFGEELAEPAYAACDRIAAVLATATARPMPEAR
jgi:methylase of polypeptide subunit release factors